MYFLISYAVMKQDMYLKKVISYEYPNVKEYDPEYPVDLFIGFPSLFCRFPNFQLRYHI